MRFETKRSISATFAEVKIPKDMLALAEHILESKAAKFDSSKFHDRYEAAIVANDP